MGVYEKAIGAYAQHQAMKLKYAQDIVEAMKEEARQVFKAMFDEEPVDVLTYADCHEHYVTCITDGLILRYNKQWLVNNRFEKGFMPRVHCQCGNYRWGSFCATLWELGRSLDSEYICPECQAKKVKQC